MNIDSTFYIVAGGPSLANFDFNRLQGKQIIAVNRAFQALPFAQTIYFSDQRFFDWFKDELEVHSAEKVTGALKIETDMPLTRYKLTGMDGLDLTKGCLRHGNNSGYAAINLAVHLGATKIVLLGYDMKFSQDGNSHWHDGYPTTNRERVFSKMICYFDTLVAPLKQLGVDIVNANSASELHAFPFVSVEEVL